MSKIALSGNASGTGTLTIAAPNTNTDRTLTLPDASGTVAVQGGAISGTTGTFTGLVDISAAGAGQIQFPATQNASSNANTLDDYEEGTFTPTFTPSIGSWTTSSSTGFYRKIGSTVMVQMSLTITTIGSGSGYINVSGLPFTAFNPSIGAGNRAAIGVIREDQITGVLSQIFISGNSVDAQCQSLTGGTVSQASGYTYNFTVTYFTAS